MKTYNYHFPKTNFLLFLFLVMGLFYCSHKDNSKDKKDIQAGLLLGLSSNNPKPSPELKIIGIQAENNTANIGNTQTIKVKVTSAYTIHDVPITFIYMNKEDVDRELIANPNNPDSTKIRSFIADTVNISQVSKGENEYTLTLNLPQKSDINKTSDILVEGTYYLVPQMDIMSVIQKRINHDASTLGSTDSSNIKAGIGYALPISLVSTNMDTSDLMINSISLNSDVLRYKAYMENDSIIDAAVSIQVVAKDYQGAKINFKLVAPDGSSINIPLYDIDILGTVNSLTIARLKRGVSFDFLAKLMITDSIKSFILPKISNASATEFKILATILNKNGLEDSKDTNMAADGRSNNNQIESSISVILDSGAVTKQSDEDCYGPQQIIKGNYIGGRTKETFTGGEWAGAGIKYTTGAEFKENGIVQTTRASVPMSLAKQRFDLASYTGSVIVDPEDEEKKKFDYNFKFVGITIWNNSSKDIDEDFSASKSYSLGSGIWLGPVNLSLTIIATGIIGLKIDISADSTYRANITPYFSINGGADLRASVVIAGAGLRGSLTLLDTKMTSSSTGNVTYDSEENRLSTGVKLYLGVEFTGIRGNLDAYVYIGIREKVWLVNIDLTKEWTHSIVNFYSWVERVTIIDEKFNAIKQLPEKQESRR